MCSWFFIAPALILAYINILFVVAQFKKDNSIADIGWAGGIMLLTLFSFLFNSPLSDRSIVITSLILIWGLRLTYYIFSRHKGEDPRYTKLRAAWGEYACVKAFLYVFILQGLLMLIIAYPAILVNTSYSIFPQLGFLSFIAVVLWTFGFLFEVIGDYQLQRFLANPDNRGKICDTGLWRYTRHPNYFGESCMWWAIFLIALPVTYGWTTIISPLTITGLFLFFMIELTEKQFDDNSMYQQYKQRTSSFFPWWPAQR